MTVIHLISIILLKKSFRKVFFLFMICFTTIGLIGAVFFSKTLVHFLICIEFVYYSIILIFILSLLLKGLINGFAIYPLIMLSLAAAEAAVGLSLLLLTSKVKRSVVLTSFNKFKG